MSVNEAMVILQDVREFNTGAAEFIVLEVAMGASVSELHECHEGLVPSPLVVNRWRRNVPMFDMLMKEAEQAKSEKLADEVVKIASSEVRQAAISGNMIKAHQWLSEKLSGVSTDAHGVTVRADIRLTDEQLMMIASGGKADEQLERSTEAKEVITVEVEPEERAPQAEPLGCSGGWPE